MGYKVTILELMFPARAGMSRQPQNKTMARGDVPRASGDEPASKAGSPLPAGCSPRERG